jgi:E3 ubiquitin-protein ligase HUWE1
MAAFDSSMDIFRNLNGVAFLVNRIQLEVDYCLQLESKFKPEELMSSSLPDCGVHQDLKCLMNRTPLLRSLMKFILHLMQNSGTVDGMRNLIDSSLVASVLKIFQHPHLFGVVGIFGLGVNVMSAFIHNEPTTLSILQEFGLPSAFLEATIGELPVSPEIISALPNAFGAICLNAVGLDQFLKVNPVKPFLNVLSKEEHLRVLFDNDVPHLVGNSMDELIRHYPSTKDIVMKSVILLLEKVLEIGVALKAEDEGCKLLSKGSSPAWQDSCVPGTDIKLNRNSDNVMAQYIDVLARFLEGLFQNVAHCKEFIKFKGLPLLTKLYQLDSIPFDFAISSSSASLSYLFRSILDVNLHDAAEHLIGEIQKTFMHLESFLMAKENSLVLSFIYLSEDLAKTASSVFRALITMKCYIRLLNDVFCSNSLAHSKCVSSLAELFAGEKNSQVLTQFAQLSQVCILERLMMTKEIPKEWYKPEEKDVLSSEDRSAAQNSKMLYHLLDDIPSDISILYRGIIKILSNRKVTTDSAKTTALTLNSIISKAIISSLQPAEFFNFTLDYLCTMLQNCRSLICEEKGTSFFLQTHFVSSFLKENGIQSLLDLWTKFWALFLESETSSSKENLGFSNVFDLILDIFNILANDKFLIESPHTLTLVSRTRDENDKFDPSKHLLQVRYLVFPKAWEVFKSNQVGRLSSPSLQKILGILISILRAKNESSMPTLGNFSNAPSLPFGGLAGFSPSIQLPSPAPIVADEGKVLILIDMGFPRQAAIFALIRCGNNLSRATDYILSHPEVLTEPAPNPPVQETQLAVEETTEEGPLLPHEAIESQILPDDDKGKASVSDDVSYQSILDGLRKELKDQILEKAIEFINEMDDSIVFVIKDLITLLGKGRSSDCCSKLLLRTNEFQNLLISGIYANDESALERVQKSLGVHYHLLALLINDSVWQEFVLKNDEFLSINFIELLAALNSFQVWIAPVLLVLESYISFCDEPVEVQLKTDPSSFDLAVAMNPNPLSFELRKSLIIHMIRILKFSLLEKFALQSILRVVLRLTRDINVAHEFVRNEGISALFHLENMALFPDQLSLVFIIFRHCLEDLSCLEKMMKSEIVSLLSIPRFKSIEVPGFIRQVAHLVCRSPDAFLAAARSACQLVSYDSPKKIITLQNTVLPEADEPIAAVDSKIKKNDTPIGTPFKGKWAISSMGVDEVVGLVQLLSSQIVAVKTQISEVPERNHLRLLFLLQSLSELIISFPKAKLDLIQSTQRRSAKQTPKFTYGKNHLLGFLLNDVLPLDLDTLDGPQALITPDRTVQSLWAMLLILCLVVSLQESANEAELSDLNAIQLIVVESVLKAFKDATYLDDKTPFEVRYGKIVQLSILCERILNPKAFLTRAKISSVLLNNHSINMAKIMIEKGYVGVFTSILADLDIHHPCSKQVIVAILSPLEKLSATALEIGNTVENSKKRTGPSLFDNAFRDLGAGGVEETPQAISDIYRNSALGMMEPNLDEEDQSSSSEDEFYDSEDEEGSEDSEPESSSEDDMEIVVPQPFHGAMQEEDDLESSDSDIGAEVIPIILPPNADDGDLIMYDDEFSDNSVEEDGDIGMDDDQNEDLSESESDQYEDIDPNDEFGAPSNMLENDDDDEDGSPIDDGMDIFDDGGSMDSGNYEDPSAHIVSSEPIIISRQFPDFSELSRVGMDWAHPDLFQMQVDHEMISGRFGLSGNRLSSSSTEMAHPLLVNQANLGNGNTSSFGSRIPIRAGILSEDNVQLLRREMLGQLFARSQMGRIENLPTTLMNPEIQSEAVVEKNQFHLYSLHFTDDRWRQEALALYGNSAADKAKRVSNSLVNQLLPAAYQAKLLLEEENKKIADERNAEEQRIAGELEKAKMTEMAEKEEESSHEDVSADVNSAGLDISMDVSAVVEMPEERLVVMVDGNAIDITGA